MANEEPFSITKLVTSPFTRLYWTKVVMIGLGLSVLLFVGYCIKNTLFPKPQQVQHNSTTVTAQSGSHITVEAPKQNMTSNKSHFSVGPFIGGSTDGDIFGGVVLLYNF